MAHCKYRPNLALNKFVTFSHYIETVEPWEDESDTEPETSTDIIVLNKSMRFRDALKAMPDYLCYKSNFATGLGILTEPEIDFGTGQSTIEQVIFSRISPAIESQLRAKFKH
jgi:hypothetical protein